MAVAEEFYLGNTHIVIMDDYCKDRTPEQVQAILRRIARNAQGALAAKAARENIRRDRNGTEEQRAGA